MAKSKEITFLVGFATVEQDSVFAYENDCGILAF